jgi:DNA-binding MurR/RpiR family transcriptional regulator
VPRIRAAQPSPKPAEARVAEFVLERPESVIYSPVSEVAEAAQTSTATVVTCAQGRSLVAPMPSSMPVGPPAQVL